MGLNTIDYLDWDSGFFGYSVAKVTFGEEGFDILESLSSRLEAEKIRLTYFFVPVTETRLNDSIADMGGILVDQKTTYSKKTEKTPWHSDHIKEYLEDEINDRLIELGLQAGLFSRFRLDKNFSKQEYERLYIEWLRKSVSMDLALKTFIALEGSEIIGITTLGGKEDAADIGLVAVDKNFRGNGIASDLIHSAENAAYDLGFKEIKVVTQLQNKAACRLYEKCDFKIENIVNIYHYWQ